MDKLLCSIIFVILSIKKKIYSFCHLNADLEWKLIYVGSAEDETYDQLLESVLVGPVNVGNYRFVLQAIFAKPFFNFLLADSVYFVL